MQHRTSCVISSRPLNATRKRFGEVDKNAFDPNFFHSRTVKKHENMDFCKLLLNLILLTTPSQERVIPTDFLEAFIAAHDRHSTVVIREKNSGANKNDNKSI